MSRRVLWSFYFPIVIQRIFQSQSISTISVADIQNYTAILIIVEEGKRVEGPKFCLVIKTICKVKFMHELVLKLVSLEKATNYLIIALSKYRRLLMETRKT